MYDLVGLYEVSSITSSHKSTEERERGVQPFFNRLHCDKGTAKPGADHISDNMKTEIIDLPYGFGDVACPRTPPPFPVYMAV